MSKFPTVCDNSSRIWSWCSDYWLLVLGLNTCAICHWYLCHALNPVFCVSCSCLSVLPWFILPQVQHPHVTFSVICNANIMQNTSICIHVSLTPWYRCMGDVRYTKICHDCPNFALELNQAKLIFAIIIYAFVLQKYTAVRYLWPKSTWVVYAMLIQCSLHVIAFIHVKVL